MLPSTNPRRALNHGFKTRLLGTTGLLAMACLSMAGGKEPVAVAAPAAAPSDGWQFQLKPYGWATGMDGTTGVGGFTTDVDVDSMEVINHLNWAFFLQAEARNGRWGVLFDGFYAELSGGGTPPNGLYSQTDFTLGQGMAELALAYRVLDTPSGFIDVFAGARYSSLEVDLNAYPSDSGIRELSGNASERVIDDVTDRVEDLVAAQLARIKSGAAAEVDRIKQGIVEKIGARPGNGLPATLRGNPNVLGKVGKAMVLSRTDGAIRDYVRAVVDARVDAARASAHSRANARLATAEKNLAKAIEKELRARLPQSAESKKDWVDPFVGMRAQWNINQRLFVAGRADVGGFGVGSDLTWQASASLGWQINETWSTELGYRYMNIDYTDGPFICDMASAGFFASVGIRF